MADVLSGGPAAPATDQSTAALIQRASDQLSTLVRSEIALAKAELMEKGKHAGLGAGLFGGGGVLALYGVGALIATCIVVLDLFLPLWLAALIMTVVLFAAAGVMALLGRKQMRRATPIEPESAIESARADVDEVKHAIKERSRA
ncbi:putative superfamily III holin-X [Krasilnikovia cinnamomea]|uniref:Putative superfamily III holin-X n=1 Tax=Krasilnikovia cinnamomea TaxID=349313 RepID=A0A4Q7ZFW4_9ACTN|nr:phage holin family protein [Krasilnikovia cinnamomea]RZU49033.1 putative superfamily III holin-X [Krasilnikovia cinnamomea]